MTKGEEILAVIYRKTGGVYQPKDCLDKEIFADFGGIAEAQAVVERQFSGSHKRYVKSVMRMRKEQRGKISDQLKTWPCPHCESTSLQAEIMPEILDEIISVICKNCLTEFVGEPYGDSLELEELPPDDEEKNEGD